MSVCCELCVRWRSLRRADQSSRGFLPCVVCVRVIEVPHRGGLYSLGMSSYENILGTINNT